MANSDIIYYYFFCYDQIECIAILEVKWNANDKDIAAIPYTRAPCMCVSFWTLCVCHIIINNLMNPIHVKWFNRCEGLNIVYNGLARIWTNEIPHHWNWQSRLCEVDCASSAIDVNIFNNFIGNDIMVLFDVWLFRIHHRLNELCTVHSNTSHSIFATEIKTYAVYTGKELIATKATESDKRRYPILVSC